MLRRTAYYYRSEKYFAYKFEISSFSFGFNGSLILSCTMNMQIGKQAYISSDHDLYYEEYFPVETTGFVRIKKNKVSGGKERMPAGRGYIIVF